MERSYDARYNLFFKKYSAIDIFRMILGFAQQRGDPYPISERGRKPKLRPYEYAAYLAFMLCMKGMPYRGMEFESVLYVQKHIDHATFVVNYARIPPEYFEGLVEDVGARLELLLCASQEHVADSTAITTPHKFTTTIKEKEVRELIEYRSHIIATIHPYDHAVVVRTTVGTTKQVADCQGAKILLERKILDGGNLHMDRGYDFERVYKASYDNHIQPNVHPRSYTITPQSQREQGIQEYHDDKRKKYRGIIETVFGGITNAKLMTTRLKKDQKIRSYTAIIMLRHNIKTLARTLANQTRQFLTKLGMIPNNLLR